MVLQRIEAALARLEAVAAQPRPAASADLESQLAPELAHELARALERAEASNSRLREAVGLSLRQIDELIAKHGPGQQP